MSKYSTEQLSARIKDIRDVKNLMGRRSFLNAYKRFGEEMDTLWCAPEKNPTVTLNDRKLEGYEAIKEWYVDGGIEVVKKGNKIMRGLYPEEFAGKSDVEMYAAGTATICPLTTPIVEIAEDRKTAKGMWYSIGEQTEIGAEGPEACWRWEKFAVDFINENDDTAGEPRWKIWHMVIFTDFLTPVDKNWADVNLAPTGEFYTAYSSKVNPQNTPLMPEPYDTFANTFSY